MKVTAIQQGDQYALAIEIKQGVTVITPDNADDVKIKLGCVTKKYSDGELTFLDGKWYFPMTQELTLSMCPNRVNIQAQIKQGDNIYGSDTESVEIDLSIIGEVW